MQVNLNTRRKLRLEGLVFMVLFLAVIGLLAWLSTRFTVDVDWTAGHRNTLSAASQQLLDRLHDPIVITAYVSENPTLRQGIRYIVGRYLRYRHDIQLKWVDPAKAPDQVRKANVTGDGDMVISYQGRQENVPFPPSEEQITNALQRVARAGDKWVVFLEGHGERSPLGQANFDLGDWGKQLRAKGLKIRSLNLADQGALPDNTAVVVIAGPQVKLLPREVDLLQAYVRRGGNLLWLGDPGELHGLAPLATQLGITFQAGTVVDATAQLVGINDPSFVVVTRYGNHPITRGFNLVTVFPQAAPIHLDQADHWHGTPLLKTGPRSWSETGKLAGTIQYDKGSDIMGPLTIAVTLTRHVDGNKTANSSGGREQRVVVTGDGDFLANSYLGNGGNLELGMNMINWLTSDDAFINIPAKTAPDVSLSLTKSQASLLAVAFLIVLPVTAFGGGLWIWWRRRRR